MTLLIRGYGTDDERHPTLLNGVILPNAIGLSGIILTLAYIFGSEG
jgi:hypothetical protein